MGYLWVALRYYPAHKYNRHLPVILHELFAASGDRAMDSYVIRIYRRDADDPRNCAGQAEIIETDKQKTFRNLDELLEILEIRGGNLPGKKEKKTVKP